MLSVFTMNLTAQTSQGEGCGWRGGGGGGRAAEGGRAVVPDKKVRVYGSLSLHA